MISPLSPFQPLLSSDRAGTKPHGSAAELLELEEVGLGAGAVVVGRLALGLSVSCMRAQQREDRRHAGAAADEQQPARRAGRAA